MVPGADGVKTAATVLMEFFMGSDPPFDTAGFISELMEELD